MRHNKNIIRNTTILNVDKLKKNCYKLTIFRKS